MAETGESGKGLRGIIVVPLVVALGMGLYLGSVLRDGPEEDAGTPGPLTQAPQLAQAEAGDQVVIAAAPAAAVEAAAEVAPEVEGGPEPVPDVPSTVEFVPAPGARTGAAPQSQPSLAEKAGAGDAQTQDTVLTTASGADATAGEVEADPKAGGAGSEAAEVAALANTPDTTPDMAPDASDTPQATLQQTGAGTGQSDVALPTLLPEPASIEGGSSALPDISADAVDPEGPQFDLVRIDATGAGLVAGRAAPGSVVRVLSGQTEIASVEATASGEFVAFIATPEDAEGRDLSLVAEDQTGAVTRSTDQVFVLPAAVEADEPRAPAVVQASAEGVRVLQPAGLAAIAGVTLDSVSYARDGAVVLAGRAPAAAALRIYADGAPLGDVSVGDSGAWDARLGDLSEGIYTLRVDEIAADGSVKSRVESPFQRVFPSDTELDRPSSITVQPGNTLWVMARERYGSGLQYTQIFAANAALIRDPDLIYPGQIFTLPADSRPAETQAGTRAEN